MQYGVVFPQTEIGADPVGVRDYAQAAEGMGFKHLLAFDHVIGANVANRENWPGPYTHQDLFHEPLVLFGYHAHHRTSPQAAASLALAAEAAQ